MRTISTLILTAALTTLAGAAAAEPLSISIPVSSRDLASSEGVAGLYDRVEAAAEQLCQAPVRGAFGTFASCKREVIAEALDRADIAVLTAYADTLRADPAPVVEIASR